MIREKGGVARLDLGRASYAGALDLSGGLSHDAVAFHSGRRVRLGGRDFSLVAAQGRADPNSRAHRSRFGVGVASGSPRKNRYFGRRLLFRAENVSRCSLYLGR